MAQGHMKGQAVESEITEIQAKLNVEDKFIKKAPHDDLCIC